MPRILQPGGKTWNNAENTMSNHQLSRQQQRNQCLLRVCLAFATIVMLYTLQSYQPDLPSGMLRIKLKLEEDYSSLILSRTRKEAMVAVEKDSPLSNNNEPSGVSIKRKIAILTSFVSKDPNNVHEARYVDHLVNKACYADVWGYDFIYNTSWGFPDEIRGRNASSSSSSTNNNSDTTRLCFLDLGHWHRVPHLIALMENEEKDYEWILWTDNDYVFWDIAQPLESLLQEIEMNALNNVYAIVPDDGGDKGQFGFSSFTILIKNSHFGRTLLQNWMAFAKGLCPNGNYEDINGCTGKFSWKFSDQPGLWYALGKTYSDLVEGSGDFTSSCNNQTGYLNVFGIYGGAYHLFNQMSDYFTNEGLIKSPDYSQIPKDQPILWSSYVKNTRSGIGVNAMLMRIPEEDRQGILGIHDKSFNGKLQQSQLQYCRTPVDDSGRGCKAGITEEGVFDLFCGNTSFVVSRGSRL